MRWRPTCRSSLALAGSAALTIAPLTALTGCAPAGEGTTSGGPCVSRYHDTTRAPSRERLLALVQAKVERNPAGARGKPIARPVVAVTGGDRAQGGATLESVGFYTDGGDGGRIGQVEIVRLTDGTWFAGVWGQCTDSGRGRERYPSGWPSDG